MKKPLTIVQLLPRLDSGGVERGTVDIARAIAAAGHQSIVISEGGRMVPELAEAGAQHIMLDVATKNPFRIWNNARKLKKILVGQQVDVLHVRSRAPAWSAYFATRKLPHCHLLATYHGTYSFKGVIKRFYNSVMTCGERIITVSEHIRSHVMKHYKVPQEKTRLIPRGTDVSYFDIGTVSEEAQQSLRESWGVAEDVSLLFVPGRMTRLKGLHVVLDALAKLPQDMRYMCVFAGDMVRRPSYVAELKAQVTMLGLDDHVLFIDVIRDMATAYSVADVVVCASVEPEAFGRVPCEAGAMQRLVIATALGGFTETIVNGKTGFLVLPDDARMLSKAMVKALNCDIETRARMGDAATCAGGEKNSRSPKCVLKHWQCMRRFAMKKDAKKPIKKSVKKIASKAAKKVSKPKQPTKIVVLLHGPLTNFVMGLGALAAIRRYAPDAHITVLTEKNM